MKHGERGSEVLEFSLILLPFLMMIFVLLDISWGLFARGTLQWAVRYADHVGVNTSSATLGDLSTCTTPLTTYVKSLVQNNSLGLLSGTSGLALIKVNYLQPPAYNSSGAATDVSSSTYADAPGNIMQVSVQGFSQGLFLPLIFFKGSNGKDPDTSPMTISVYSAGLIENTGPIPCVGTAP